MPKQTDPMYRLLSFIVPFGLTLAKGKLNQKMSMERAQADQQLAEQEAKEERRKEYYDLVKADYGNMTPEQQAYTRQNFGFEDTETFGKHFPDTPGAQPTPKFGSKEWVEQNPEQALETYEKLDRMGWWEDEEKKTPSPAEQAKIDADNALAKSRTWDAKLKEQEYNLNKKSGDPNANQKDYLNAWKELNDSKKEYLGQLQTTMNNLSRLIATSWDPQEKTIYMDQWNKAKVKADSIARDLATSPFPEPYTQPPFPQPRQQQSPMMVQDTTQTPPAQFQTATQESTAKMPVQQPTGQRAGQGRQRPGGQLLPINENIQQVATMPEARNLARQILNENGYPTDDQTVTMFLTGDPENARKILMMLNQRSQ